MAVKRSSWPPTTVKAICMPAHFATPPEGNWHKILDTSWSRTRPHEHMSPRHQGCGLPVRVEEATAQQPSPPKRHPVFRAYSLPLPAYHLNHLLVSPDQGLRPLSTFCLPHYHTHKCSQLPELAIPLPCPSTSPHQELLYFLTDPPRERPLLS